jgi:hypothetical protein
MAVIRASRVQSPRQNELVQRLANELRSEHHRQQPFIYINDVAQTGTHHVTVLWDEWRSLTPQQRSKVVVGAFEQCKSDISGPLTIALGLTGEEASRLGLTPFKVQLLLKPGEESRRAELEQFLRMEGAFETAEGPQLLFRTLDQADEAYQRLQSEAPGPHWAIVREIPREQ